MDEYNETHGKRKWLDSKINKFKVKSLKWYKPSGGNKDISSVFFWKLQCPSKKKIKQHIVRQKAKVFFDLIPLTLQ